MNDLMEHGWTMNSVDTADILGWGNMDMEDIEDGEYEYGGYIYA